jgi:hypothetical protein
MLFLCGGLLEDVGVALIVCAREVVRRCVAAHVTIYAERIHVIGAGNVLLYAIIRISQIRLLKAVTSDE